MGLSAETITEIEHTICESLRQKFRNYRPESKAMPFHHRLLGKDRMALYSFIQSLNTTFGVSIFEPVATTLAKTKFRDARTQVSPVDRINHEAQSVIQDIMNNLSTGTGTAPDKTSDIERIRLACRSTHTHSFKTPKIDLLVESETGAIFCFDLKTVKPNIGNFKEYKRTLLEWCAVFLTQNPDADIHSLIAIPYNPYEPKPYDRWTMRGMLDLPNELKVAAEFWDFLGGEGAYLQVLDCFERAGNTLRPEIDDCFAKFTKVL